MNGPGKTLAGRGGSTAPRDEPIGVLVGQDTSSAGTPDQEWRLKQSLL
jgi:hypothetical protein